MSSGKGQAHLTRTSVAGRHISAAPLPLALTSLAIVVGEMIGTHSKVNHGLPEYSATPMQALPDLFPGIMGCKIVPRPEMLQAALQAGSFLCRGGSYPLYFA